MLLPQKNISNPISAFYTTVSGFFRYYFIKFPVGDAKNLSFRRIYASLPVYVGFMVVVVISFFVLSFGLRKGPESVTKYIMVALFLLLIGMAVYACTLPGASEGLSFYLKPDFSLITVDTLIKVLNQSFFSLWGALPYCSSVPGGKSAWAGRRFWRKPTAARA